MSKGGFPLETGDAGAGRGNPVATAIPAGDPRQQASSTAGAVVILGGCAASVSERHCAVWRNVGGDSRRRWTECLPLTRSRQRKRRTAQAGRQAKRRPGVRRRSRRNIRTQCATYLPPARVAGSRRSGELGPRPAEPSGQRDPRVAAQFRHAAKPQRRLPLNI